MRWRLTSVVLLAIGGLTGCESTAAGQPPAPPLTQASASAAGTETAQRASGEALQALSQVPVKGRAPETGYERSLFGDGWVDTDHNGCDTRNDILARDLRDETFKSGTHDCVVLTGTLADPYSGRTIAFQRGQDTSEAVQIDHVVALSDAWQKGAQHWTNERRKAFANDPLNLLAVDGPLNQQKSDGDAATWLPPNRAFRCDYVARQVAVKVSYGLWMTQAERDAIASILATCPAEPLPTAGSTPVQAPAVVTSSRTVVLPSSTPPTSVAPSPAPAPVPAPVGQGTVSYRNCTEVRAAGAAPIHPGDPGWRDSFDRDGDGVGCE